MATETTTLGELLDRIGGSLKTGPFGTKLKASEYTQTGVPVVSVGEVGFGRLKIHENTPRVDATVWNRMPEYLLKTGDIVFGRKGAVERSAYIRPEEDGYFIGSDGIRVRLNDRECDPLFIAYQFQSPAHRAWMIQNAAGTTMPSLNEGIIRRIPITLKPLPEQKAIARILGTLDDKIELNRRMNATLEAMARALFQSWFVDFDPVHSNAARRPPAGMDAQTAALFPASFQESGLGEIPVGWQITTVGECCERIFSGGTPNTSTAGYWNGEIPWLSSGETRSSFIIETEKKITNAGVENSSTKLARSGCTVIASAGQGHTRGQTSLLTFDSYINQSVVALAANPKISSDLFLFFDLARRYDEFRQLSDSHSSRGSLTTKLLAGINCVLPAPEIIAAFDKAVSPLVRQNTANLHQSRTLASLRDTLLPKLLSGEVEAKHPVVA